MGNSTSRAPHNLGRGRTPKARVTTNITVTYSENSYRMIYLIYTYTYIYIYLFIYLLIYFCISLSIYVSMYMYIYIYRHIYIYIHVSPYTYTYICTYTQGHYSGLDIGTPDCSGAGAGFVASGIALWNIAVIEHLCGHRVGAPTKG